uniref:Uncharacterized protein n=1 Tax=Anopheles albimanus TaxID=7167 RepID=A0A182FQ36_ANOAL
RFSCWQHPPLDESAISAPPSSRVGGRVLASRVHLLPPRWFRTEREATDSPFCSHHSSRAERVETARKGVPGTAETLCVILTLESHAGRSEVIPEFANP